MAYKQIIQKNLMEAQVDASGYTSPAENMYLCRTFSVQLEVSGVAGGATVDVTLEISNDGSNWFALATEQMTADESVFFTLNTSLVFFKYCRVVKEIDMGSAKVKAYLLGVGDDC